MNIVAYSYEADYHCIGCTISRFGLAPEAQEDCEGNPVHPVFDHEEIEDQVLVCGTCEEPID